jgi:hypothetical protein
LDFPPTAAAWKSAESASGEIWCYMRMVIDSSVLTEDALRDFLSKSKKNKVVITDYLMIEALKEDPLNKIFRLMKIACEHPNQVVVLKSMRRLTALKGRRCGMTRRMIESGQTKGFGVWCAGLDKAEAGDKEYRRQLVEAGNDASEQMNRIIAAQSTYAKVIEDEAKKYTADELQILRTDQPYTQEMLDKMAERVISLTIKFFEHHPDQVKMPIVWELPDPFLFRFAVCAYVQTLRRIRDVGAQGVKADKIANDIVDATFAAHATYFQGLLSKDAKATELYRNVKHVLKGFPVSPDKLGKLLP